MVAAQRMFKKGLTRPITAAMFDQRSFLGHQGGCFEYQAKSLRDSDSSCSLWGGLIYILLNVGVNSGARGEASDSAGLDRTVLAETLPCTTEKLSPNFLTYGLGKSIHGHELVEVIRRCDLPYPNEPVAANYVSYIYGECEPRKVEQNRSSCQPPVEIQTWPPCQRALSDSDSDYIGLEARRLNDVGDARQYKLGGDRIEVYSGVSTVVIFSSDPAILELAAQNLVLQDYVGSRDWLDAGRKPDESIQISSKRISLQAPAAGSMNGETKCA